MPMRIVYRIDSFFVNLRVHKTGFIVFALGIIFVYT